MGYVIPGIKDVKAARVGDTWHLARQPVEPLPGFKPIKPMVFAGARHYCCEAIVTYVAYVTFAAAVACVDFGGPQAHQAHGLRR